MSQESRGVSKDQIVNVGVFDGTVSILPSAVEQKHHAQESGSTEDCPWSLKENSEGGHGRCDVERLASRE